MDRDELLEELKYLLDLVEKTGDQLANGQALVTEWNVEPEDCRGIIANHGKIGVEMIKAVKRTREKLGLEKE